jgi:hypothetical protein
VNADDLIRARLTEGRRVPPWVGGSDASGSITGPVIFGSDTDYRRIAWKNPRAARAGKAWQDASHRTSMGVPGGDHIVPKNDDNTSDAKPYKPWTGTNQEFRSKVHKTVVRRLLKHGVVQKHGDGIKPGPNFDSYHSTMDRYSTGAFFQSHDVGQHTTLGVRGDWPGEHHTFHMTRLLDQMKAKRDAPRAVANYNGTGHMSRKDLHKIRDEMDVPADNQFR